MVENFMFKVRDGQTPLPMELRKNNGDEAVNFSSLEYFMKVYENPNDAWIMHREDIETIKEGSCNVYFLLDAVSGFCFTQKAVVDLLSSSEILEFLNIAYKRMNGWPKEILISKKDPLIETLEAICKGKKLNFNSSPPKDLATYVKPLKDSLKDFKMGVPSRVAMPVQ
jgi:hypothetical protein